MKTSELIAEDEIPVQIPSETDSWGGSKTIGYAATAEGAAALAEEHGVTDAPELYARLDTLEWHVGF